ncbi:MAG TPA: nucleoside hydrolase [Candidatus Hydrogenedentes bacterium]|nr:nucleoside hydrolase [Candidatus Hydrogenedentota bacterium]
MAWLANMSMAVILILGLGVQAQAGAQTAKEKIPIIYSTDLYHPHGDPDDHYDLLTLFSIPEFDIRAIIIDMGKRGKGKPGIPALQQVMALRGKTVPYATGLMANLTSPEDKGDQQSEADQAGVALILKALQESAQPVTLFATGSLRDMAAAFNRKPDLFKNKVKRFYVNAGDTSGKVEWNVGLDLIAYQRILTSGLPIFWVPCFGEGGFASYWKFKQGDILANAPKPVQNFFLYMLTQSKEPDAIAALNADPDPDAMIKFWAEDRNMWCTAAFLDAAGRKNDSFSFSPQNVLLEPNGSSRIALEGALKLNTLHVDKPDEYPAAMLKTLQEIVNQPVPERVALRQPLRAGFARTDVTPAVGGEIPGGFGKNMSKGVHDPLWAEAAYFTDGITQLAVVGADLLMIPREVIMEARRQAEARCGIPGGNIMVGASHTHNGGPIVACFSSESDPAYCAFAAERIAEAVVKAHADAVDAKLGSGVGYEDSVARNRRFRMKDGTVRTHPGKMNPDIVSVAGPMDPDVAVISVQNMQGDFLGCIVNYALHGTTMGGSMISADWPCYLRQTIRGGLGADIGVVFLNGACGDVTQVDNQSPRPSEFGEAWSRRVGMCVGSEALRVLIKLDYTGDVPLGVTSEILALPIRDLMTSDEELLEKERPGSGLGSSGNDIYLNEIKLVRAMKENSPTVDVEVQAMRIGDTGIASNTAEYFCQLGLNIKHDSPWKTTMVAELTNGYNGYCPTIQAFQGGGYETRTARSSYLAPGTGETIAETSVKLLCQLQNK